jgi:putative flippase GtrA
LAKQSESGLERTFAGAKPGIMQRWIKDQRLLFLMVGGANTAFSTLLYIGLIYLFGPNTPAVVSLAIAWGISLVLVFFVYRRLVFRVEGGVWKDLIRFSSVNVVSLLLNSVALTVLTEFAGLPPIPVQIAITCLIVIFNYIGHKHYSFRRQ